MIITTNPPAGALLIDSRSPAEYAQGHLAGAVNADLSGFRSRLRTDTELANLEQALADLNGKIGASQGQPVVVYDSGLSTRLAKTAFMLALSGLTVHLWPSGWESAATDTTLVQPSTTTPWAKLNRDILLTADEVLKESKVLDVREVNEFAAGHIPKAVNVPLGQFGEGIAERLGLQAGEEVGVHCRSGARSASAFWILREQGIKAKNYLGSMLEWEAENDLPIER